MKTILVPLDGSPFSEYALPPAIMLARRAGAGLVLAHVHQIAIPAIAMSGEVMYDATLDEYMRSEERGYLEGVLGRVTAIWDGPVRCDLLEAPVAPALIDHVRATGADLVVMSTHGRGGFTRAWLGSVADRLIRQSPAPVLVIHPDEEPPVLAEEPGFEHILIPLDGSPGAEAAIPLARSVGDLTNARYTLIQVLEPVAHSFAANGLVHDPQPLTGAWEHAHAYLEKVAAPLRAAGLHIAIQTPVGRPAETLLEFLNHNRVDVIAMTTHGRSGLTRMLLGSVADKLVRGATEPLLITCAPEEE
jgi:nucleotide-binding universal stress UspA family protein